MLKQHANIEIIASPQPQYFYLKTSKYEVFQKIKEF